MIQLLTFHTGGRPRRILVEGLEADLQKEFRQMMQELNLPENNPTVPLASWAVARIEAILAKCRELGIEHTDVDGLFMHLLSQRGYAILEFKEVDLVI